MVDTWAKVDAHALALALTLALALALGLAVSLAVVLTPNAKSPTLMLAQPDCCRQFTDFCSLTHSLTLLTYSPSPTASMATRRSACTAPITTGSSKAARPHSPSWRRQLTASRHEAPSR